jgi:hypothetical protein
MLAAKPGAGLCTRLVLLGALTAPGAAWPCSPWCDGWQSGIAPPEGTSAPASAFAFPVKWLPSGLGAYGPTPLDGGVTLARADGGAIPIEIAHDDPEGWFLIHPLESIAEGEALTLRVKDVCWSNDTWLHSTFTATAAVPRPASAGTFALLEEDAGIVTAFTGCGACTKPIRAGMARFRFTPSAELEPWIRIASLTLLVDGQPWAIHEYGRVSPDAGATGPTHSYTEVFTRCDADPRESDVGLPPGDHTASLVIHVAGGSVDPPPLQAAFHLSCANVGAVPFPPDPCPGGPLTDAGPQLWPDAGDGGSTQPPGAPPPCGCSTGAAGLLALAAALTNRLNPAARG